MGNVAGTVIALKTYQEGCVFNSLLLSEYAEKDGTYYD